MKSGHLLTLLVLYTGILLYHQQILNIQFAYMYYADTNEEFKPEILPHDKHTHLVCQNPVAGARFFHFYG